MTISPALVRGWEFCLRRAVPPGLRLVMFPRPNLDGVMQADVMDGKTVVATVKWSIDSHPDVADLKRQLEPPTFDDAAAWERGDAAADPS